MVPDFKSVQNLLNKTTIDCRADYLKTDNEDRIQTCDNLALDL